MKRKVPAYVERAILRLSDDSDMVREVERLMPHSAYRVGVCRVLLLMGIDVPLGQRAAKGEGA